jgi:hypothetical protein
MESIQPFHFPELRDQPGFFVHPENVSRDVFLSGASHEGFAPEIQEGLQLPRDVIGDEKRDVLVEVTPNRVFDNVGSVARRYFGFDMCPSARVRSSSA